MPLYALFYLILAYATPLAALPSPVERADKIIFSRGINFALENATKAGKYGQRKEERSFWKKRIARLEGMTTAHCANFQAENRRVPVNVSFDGSLFQAVPRGGATVSRSINAPGNPSVVYSISDTTGSIGSGLLNFGGFCPMSASHLNLLVVHPKFTSSSVDNTITLFSKRGPNRCAITTGNNLRVFWIHAVKGQGTFFHSEIRGSSMSAFDSNITSTNFNMGHVQDSSFSGGSRTLYTYLNFQPTLGRRQCHLCSITASSSSSVGAIWIVFYGSEGVFSTISLGITKIVSSGDIQWQCTPNQICISEGESTSNESGQGKGSGGGLSGVILGGVVGGAFMGAVIAFGCYRMYQKTIAKMLMPTTPDGPTDPEGNPQSRQAVVSSHPRHSAQHSNDNYTNQSPLDRGSNVGFIAGSRISLPHTRTSTTDMCVPGLGPRPTDIIQDPRMNSPEYEPAPTTSRESTQEDNGTKPVLATAGSAAIGVAAGNAGGSGAGHGAAVGVSRRMPLTLRKNTDEKSQDDA